MHDTHESGAPARTDPTMIFAPARGSGLAPAAPLLLACALAFTAAVLAMLLK